MTAQIREGAWVPLEGALPEHVAADRIYVIPTRDPSDGSDVPRYTDTVRYFPKEARVANIPLAFSRNSGSREFLSEYSVDPEMWSLGLACMQIASDWLILSVSLFITYRAKSQGWSEDEAKQLPLRVRVAETETGRNYEIEGSGAEVLEALQMLQTDRSDVPIESIETNGPKEIKQENHGDE